ncbi:hypothetical protein BGZ74_010759 [Mortierella antarctica]|nr:hypothetical protein BGZ74_010759 [Mortierella antarctica]
MRFFVLAIALTTAAMVQASPVDTRSETVAQGEVRNSPGVLTGNTVKVPVVAPINACGNSIDLIGLINGARSNVCSQMSWVATSYLIAYNTFNRLYGRLSDIFGRKNMILTACIIFLLGSIGWAAASSLIMLILFRAVQGFGACGLSSIAMIIVGDMFTDVVERARYQSVFWASFAISSIVGPLVGGVIVEHASWRWCFWINLPLGALAIASIVLFHQLPFRPSWTIWARFSSWRLSLICSTGGTTFAWNSPAVISMICVFVVLLGILVLVEFHATEAITPPALFKNRDIVILYFVNCVVGLIFMGCTFYVPLYLQVVQGTSTTVTGVRLMPNVIGVCISTVPSSFALKWVKNLTKLPAEMQGVIAEMDMVNNVNAVPLLPENVRVLVVRAYADGFQFLFKVLTLIVGLALLLSFFLP